MDHTRITIRVLQCIRMLLVWAIIQIWHESLIVTGVLDLNFFSPSPPLIIFAKSLIRALCLETYGSFIFCHRIQEDLIERGSKMSSCSDGKNTLVRREWDVCLSIQNTALCQQNKLTAPSGDGQWKNHVMHVSWLLCYSINSNALYQ